MIKSPSKYKPNKFYVRFEFGVVSPDNEEIKRISSYSQDLHEYLTNSNIAGDPLLAIPLDGMERNSAGFTFNSGSSFGEVVKLQEPYLLTHDQRCHYLTINLSSS